MMTKRRAVRKGERAESGTTVYRRLVTLVTVAVAFVVVEKKIVDVKDAARLENAPRFGDERFLLRVVDDARNEKRRLKRRRF